MLSAIRARAWWYLVAVAALTVIFGVGDILNGATADPGIALGLTGLTLVELEQQSAAAYRAFDFTTRSQGWGLTVFGVLLLGLLLGPYRRGDRWAWLTLWILPTWAIGVAVLYLAFGLEPGQSPPPPLLSGPILGAIAVIVLLLDRRRFVDVGAARGRF